MQIIVGLGNPGDKYSQTRHNIGFHVIEALAKRASIVSFRDKFSAHVAEATLVGERVVFVKPQTFMNLSGNALSQILTWYKLPITDTIVIHDDLDLPFGTLRLRRGGGAGGHNGVGDIVRKCGGAESIRVRCGIGRPTPPMAVADYVLSGFSGEEKGALESFVLRSADAVECVVRDGLTVAMNTFNGKGK